MLNALPLYEFADFYTFTINISTQFNNAHIRPIINIEYLNILHFLKFYLNSKFFKHSEICKYKYS